MHSREYPPPLPSSCRLVNVPLTTPDPRPPQRATHDYLEQPVLRVTRCATPALPTQAPPGAAAAEAEKRRAAAAADQRRGLSAAGTGLRVLAQVLDEIEQIGGGNVAVVTNEPALVDLLAVSFFCFVLEIRAVYDRRPNNQHTKNRYQFIGRGGTSFEARKSRLSSAALYYSSCFDQRELDCER